MLIALVEEGVKFAFPDFKFGWTMTAIELYIFSLFAVIETMLKESSILFFNDTNNRNGKQNSSLLEASNANTHNKQQ